MSTYNPGQAYDMPKKKFANKKSRRSNHDALEEPQGFDDPMSGLKIDFNELDGRPEMDEGFDVLQD